MKIRQIIAEPGSRSCGMIEVAKRYDSSPIGIPVIVVSGTEDGPVLCIASGVHGDEYVGGEAIRRFCNSVDPKQLRGALIGVPCANMAAFEVGTRASAWDGRDMNRVFPGRPEGHVTEMIAYSFFNEVVLKSNYCVDFHSPGAFFKALPLVNYREAEGELGKKTMELAKAVGIEHLWHYERGGSLATEAMKRGVSSLVIDYIGDEALVSEQHVSFGVKCLTNISIHLGMIKGTLEPPKKLTFLLGRTVSDNQMFSKCGGFFQRQVEVGQRVKKGDVLGIIYDVFGEESERILTPHDAAIVVAIRTYPSIKPGDWCAFAPQVMKTS